MKKLQILIEGILDIDDLEQNLSRNIETGWIELFIDVYKSRDRSKYPAALNMAANNIKAIGTKYDGPIDAANLKGKRIAIFTPELDKIWLCEVPVTFRGQMNTLIYNTNYYVRCGRRSKSGPIFTVNNLKEIAQPRFRGAYTQAEIYMLPPNYIAHFWNIMNKKSLY